MNRRTGVVAVLYRLARYGAPERKLSACIAIWKRSAEPGQFETRRDYPPQPLSRDDIGKITQFSVHTVSRVNVSSLHIPRSVNTVVSRSSARTSPGNRC